MLRYIKVNNTWYDTLAEIKEKGHVYMIIDNTVILIIDSENEVTVGKIQEERDDGMPL